MKRYLKISVFAVLILALAISFSVAGCKTGATTAKGTTAKTMKASDVTIGYSVWTMEFTFFQNLEKGVKDACKAFGFKYTMIDQKSDATQMVQDLNTLVNQKVSGIVVTPVDPGAMAPAVQKARDAGIPVVCADIGKSGPVNALIISNNFQGGQLAAEYLAKLFPDKKTVFGLANLKPQWTYARQRGEGFKAKCDELGYTVKSEIIVQNPSAEGGYDTMQQIMSAAPETKGVFVTSGREATGAANYVKSQNLDVKVVGYNGDPEEFNAIKDGIEAATILQQPYVIGYKAVETLKEILVDGKSYENVEIPAEVKLVTPENLNQIADEILKTTGNSAFGTPTTTTK
ncbi:MAG: substrate-binding domain-containing protein [Actinobacteria bacterium]|nr:substrate-binding domain-containing protein [Cyanobacteriota bacterium]MCL5771339.1 substrate-binding domain-containing protein [Actinomycetota bacterium]